MITNNTRKQRNSNVLRHIIKLYVSTAVPVSSKSVAKLMDDAFSSATIRNIMAELEEEGLIEQPHTSAGRVPTDQGYRQYVDMVKRSIQLEKETAKRLAYEYAARVKSIKDIIEKTSFLIGRELHNPGIVMWPSVDNFYLKHLQLVKVKAETVHAILVTVTNAVKNYIIKMDKDINKDDLEKISMYINRNFEDKEVSDILNGLKDVIKREENAQALETARTALEIIDSVVDKDIENEVYYEGLNYFTEGPEFKNPEVSRRVLCVFSDRKLIGKLMRSELPFEGIRTYIGRENESDMMRDCGMVTSGYRMHGKTIGRIGVVGPTRMDYERVLRTMSYLSEVISKKLEEF